MKGYAQSQSVDLEIDGTYMGKAVEGNSTEIYNDDFYGNISPRIIGAVYVVPFLVVLFVWFKTTLVVIGHVYYTSFEEEKLIKTDLTLQANIVSVVLICALTTLGIFCLDVTALVKEDHSSLPSYYPKHHPQYIYVITIALWVVIGILFIIGIVFGRIFLCYKNSKNYHELPRHERSKIVTLFFVSLIIGSAVLSLSFHFPNILMEWATDAFYASRIGLFYGIMYFCYFCAPHVAYIAVHKIIELWRNNHNTISTSEKDDKPKEDIEMGDLTNNPKYDNPEYSPTKNTSEVQKPNPKDYTAFIIFLVVAFPVSFGLVTAVIATFSTFVASVNVNNSIETSADGVTTIYNGAVVLIGGLLAFRIGWYYIGHPFSVKDALKNAVKEVDLSKMESGWKNLTEEERLTKVLVKHIEQAPCVCSVIQTENTIQKQCDASNTTKRIVRNTL